MKRCVILLVVLATVFFAGAVLTHAAWQGTSAQAGEAASSDPTDNLTAEQQVMLRWRADRPSHWRAMVMQR